jgi:hypothetical protein
MNAGSKRVIHYVLAALMGYFIGIPAAHGQAAST